ncbi:adenylosuccinate lyase, partial [bacterium]|nr:adenylosuccinate lyase [bacterium]
MIERYSNKEMSEIWSLQYKFNTFLKVEIAVCEAYFELGEIPKNALDEIKSKASFSVERIEALEKELKHDVLAFLTNLNESVGENSKYIHMGLTSSDVIDTALSLQILNASEIISKDLDIVISTLKNMAIKYKNTICVGRSHGIHAEPMTFGV